jgi:hypothetical protein
LSVLFFGTRRVLLHCHWLRRYYFHSTYVPCLFSISTSGLALCTNCAGGLVQLIQKILICKVLNSCTKRKLHEQESRTTQFRVPPWKPDGLGAPGSYRVELIGVTPLAASLYGTYQDNWGLGKSLTLNAKLTSVCNYQPRGPRPQAPAGMRLCNYSVTSSCIG